MSNLYHLTARIHEFLPQVKAKYNLKFDVESDYYWFMVERDWSDDYLDQPTPSPDFEIQPKNFLGRDWFDDETDCQVYTSAGIHDNYYIYIPAIEATQIREILVGLQSVLGIKADQFEKKNLCLTHNQNGRLILPLIDREPETVLQELVEVLENLLK